MKATLKKVAVAPVGAMRRAAARRALKALTAAELPQLRQVGAALQDALGGGPDAADRARIATIEARRAELAASKARIDVLDYGAGRPGDKRSEAEMRAGVRTTAAVADVCAASKPAFWAALLYHLVRRLEPSSALELGTCVGISAAYQGVAMARNGRGRLRTLEGAPSIAELARRTFAAAGLDNVEVVVGPFHETLGAALAAAAPLDFFFNDGHHDHDAVLRRGVRRHLVVTRHAPRLDRHRSAPARPRLSRSARHGHHHHRRRPFDDPPQSAHPALSGAGRTDGRRLRMDPV